MKKYISVLLTAVLSLSLLGCQNNKDDAMQMQKEFAEFIQNDFEDTLEEDYLSYHIYLENPKNYGIEREDMDIDFGDVFNDEEYRENRQEIKDIEEKFKKFNRDLLTVSQQKEYDQMRFLLSYVPEMSDRKFDYYSSYFSTMGGIHTAFKSTLADFHFRNEQDIKDYIKLLKSYLTFSDEVLTYTKEQAKRGTMMIDIDEVVKSCKETLKIGDQSSILTSVNKNIDALKLDNKLSDRYKKEIHDAYVNNYLKGIQNISTTLSNLKKSQNNTLGLCYLENGKEYYELLFKNATSSSCSIEDMKSLLKKQSKNSLRKLVVLMTKHPDVYEKLENAKTRYKDYESILEDLKTDIVSDFPQFSNTEYEIKPLSQDLATNGIAAYFNIPALDSTSPRQMFVNTLGSNDDNLLKVNSIETFTTVAHEGIPGHMYQIEYMRNHEKSNWLKLQSSKGFTEGYATYVELYSLNYLKDDIDENVIDLLFYNNEYVQCISALIDIGIHYEGWDQEKTAQFLKKSGLTPSAEVYKQIQANPGIFLSYYCGYVEIIDLKNEAKKELGEQFVLKDFHEALLDSGNVSFEIVKNRIHQYIEETRK